jgi:hypothetical protein
MAGALAFVEDGQARLRELLRDRDDCVYGSRQ